MWSPLKNSTKNVDTPYKTRKREKTAPSTFALFLYFKRTKNVMNPKIERSGCVGYLATPIGAKDSGFVKVIENGNGRPVGFP
jgi:hypothetical protein